MSEALYLRDPDGNGVELYSDRPEHEWPRTPDGRLAMHTRWLDLRTLLDTSLPEAPGPGTGPWPPSLGCLARLGRTPAICASPVVADLRRIIAEQAEGALEAHDVRHPDRGRGNLHRIPLGRGARPNGRGGRPRSL